ncbi:MAG: NADH-quinone oxidoreductase subunit G [Rhodanobacter sp.]|nr:MAG: NADH-quinone oxidoreductase subunit G [Rhodanobacter sp.]TAM05104.1 MAG: NADH-quinone oxidoreductase subunit G [Rhodanobacter sp.]TAM42497.1 MAG: NADH-quinone oxidoreductase subunit G [Rhodanobacter sp.]TAN26155.1 MAG: NADH-quinone oxidoreductase subunit G [Rhodanobacter sp.]
MSAQPTSNATDMVNIEIDGKAMQAPKGSMIIQAADQAGIVIPRFCYHRKLAIAANCRMCMVEVEMGGRPVPKGLPACATPVTEGMKVQTRSRLALQYQRDVMEFLLINHPLDCPVCDQGGECELQDLSLGFGRSVSRFTERKRAVADENIGPLVKTYMTRCIHCTRCIRVLNEVAGSPEFGAMGRTEDMVVGTYIGKNIDSELSGNIIDVCPVGALTDKVFQFKARAWELIAKPSIGYHDALGSNLWLHTRRGEVLRTVPRDNEAVNECWLSDRDRYSHQGMYAEDRLHAPQVKRDGKWQTTTWDDALSFAGNVLKQVPGNEIGILVHPATSNEEGDLLLRLARGLGSAHIDHRVRQLDFADHAVARPFTLPVAEISAIKSALLVGCDLRQEMPLLNHRVFEATKHGAQIYAVNPVHFDFNYRLAGEAIVAPPALVDALLALASAATSAGAAAPAALADAINAAQSDQGDRDAIEALQSGKSVIMLGAAAVTHPQASWLRAIARFIAEATGAGYDELPVGANAIGLGRLGILPGDGGLDAQAMLAQPRKSYVLYGVEPPYDFADGSLALKALRAADRVVAFSAYAGAALRDVADVILPIALLPEIDATLINVDGLAQGVAAGAKAPGQARPGWRVLRALGGALQLAGFEFDDLAGLREGIREPAMPAASGLATRTAVDGLTRIATWPIYRGDAVLRRATALNAHPLNRAPAVRLNADEAARMGLAAGDEVRLHDVLLPVLIDVAVPDRAVWIEAAQDLTATLPPYGAAITLSKA